MTSSTHAQSAGITKPKKKPPAPKVRQLPTGPHDRLNTLTARLNLPPPALVIYEQKRFRAEVVPGPPPCPKKQHVNVFWKQTVVSTGGEDGETWFSSVKDARRHAAEFACPGLERRLRNAVQELNANPGAAAPAASASGHDHGDRVDSKVEMEEDKEDRHELTATRIAEDEIAEALEDDEEYLDLSW